MSFLRKAHKVWYVACNRILFLSQHVECSEVREVNGVLFVRNEGAIGIGRRFKANSGATNNPIGGDTVLRLIVGPGASISIGNNVGISNSTLFSRDSIVIEDDVNIGGGCHIYDTDFHSVAYTSRMASPDPDVKVRPVRICKGAWLGGGCTVLKGVTIGERAVVGAGSVVTCDIPADEVWAGNPARYIKAIVQ